MLLCTGALAANPDGVDCSEAEQAPVPTAASAPPFPLLRLPSPTLPCPLLLQAEQQWGSLLELHDLVVAHNVSFLVWTTQLAEQGPAEGSGGRRRFKKHTSCPMVHAPLVSLLLRGAAQLDSSAWWGYAGRRSCLCPGSVRPNSAGRAHSGWRKCNSKAPADWPGCLAPPACPAACLPACLQASSWRCTR